MGAKAYDVYLGRREKNSFLFVVYLTDRDLSVILNAVTNLQAMTREEIEQKMDELSRRYVESHEDEILKQLYFLAPELEQVDKQSDKNFSHLLNDCGHGDLHSGEVDLLHASLTNTA